MILYREISWWYWAVTAVLLIVGLAGWFEAFYLATGLSIVQVFHFRLRASSFAAFPVQVRVAYTAMLLIALWGADELVVLGACYWYAGPSSVRLLHLGALPVVATLEPPCAADLGLGLAYLRVPSGEGQRLAGTTSGALNRSDIWSRPSSPSSVGAPKPYRGTFPES